MFFHGGGWVIGGDVDSYTTTCTTMAELTGRVVCSVDYRLAPEHPFPAGLNDCLRVTERLLAEPSLLGARGGPEEVILIGDSAGGNLAAAVSLVLRAEGSALPGGPDPVLSGHPVGPRPADQPVRFGPRIRDRAAADQRRGR